MFNRDTVVNLFHDVILFKEQKGRVRALPGFAKGHREPTTVNSATTSFIQNIGEEAVRHVAEDIYKKVRATFAYKRKELSFIVEHGRAAVKSPAFEVEIVIIQNETIPNEYLLTTRVHVIDAAIVDDDGFLSIFTAYCDTVIMEFTTAMDIEEKIDLIEDDVALSQYLSYDPECTFLELRFKNPNFCILMKPHAASFSLVGESNLKKLVEATRVAVEELGKASVKLNRIA